MLSDLTARSDVRGRRVDLAWTWSGLGDRPAFRLVRRRTAYPTGPDDGYPVLDTSALFRAPDEPWPSVEQLRFLAAGSSAEGGLLQAAVTLFGEEAAEVALHGLAPQRLDGLTAVTRSDEEIAFVPGGTLTIGADQLDWAPDAGAPAAIGFDAVAALHTGARVLAATDQELAVEWTREDAVFVLRERFSEDSGDWTRAVEVRDLGAATEEPAYYRLFRDDDGGGWVTERDWIVRATATAPYGFPDRLYELLPALHRNHDEPDPAVRGNGQLRRFLGPFGVALDHLRSEAESLRDRHDPVRAREDLLPPLGGWIGWPVDRTAPLPVQRSEIRMAPDVYDTVGTVPNIVALATRVTGWPCAAKEFVHNVFMTNAPEAVPVRELREMAYDGTAWGAPLMHATTEDFDGRPSAVLDGGTTRLFWHSNRSGRWEIWTRGLGVSDPAPLFPADPDAAPPAWSDLSPAAIAFGGARWLFWESDRHGVLDVWAQVDGETPFALTSHAAADRRPSPAVGSDGALWVFWESERRGRPEIWSRRYDGTAWSAAVRVTEGLGRDHEPAAALDAAGDLRLVWRRDESDRSRLYERAFAGGAWGPIEPLEDGSWRDESPTLALLGGELWLLWHSDRTGRWELWARARDAGGWGAPQQLTQRPDPDKEPAVIADGAALRVFWRSERIAPQYRSRTVDVTDVGALEQLGRLPDRLHYTYDAARGELDWYARDVAGLYLTPPPGTPDPVVEDVLERARTYLEPFCPATVRLVLIPVRAAEAADLHTDDFDQSLVDLFQDETE